MLRNTGSSLVDVSTDNRVLNLDHGFAQNVGWADIKQRYRVGHAHRHGGTDHKRTKFIFKMASHVFTAVSASVGFSKSWDESLRHGIGDTDGDGDLDVFISTWPSAAGKHPQQLLQEHA